MKKNTIKGNLIKLAQDGAYDVIVHCQNCFHGWGKGFVVELGKAFPEAVEADLNTIKGDKGKLGNYSFAKVVLDSGKSLFIVNAYAQYSYGQGKHIVDSHLASCLEKINIEFSGLNIGYPLIGCGQAGGDWNDISSIIDTALTDVDHQLITL